MLKTHDSCLHVVVSTLGLFVCVPWFGKLAGVVQCDNWKGYFVSESHLSLVEGPTITVC